jgi:predicted negative regulator of RcsB-dependent stress response
MDADRRHQLKTNELAEALGKVREIGSDPQSRYWLIGIIVVLAVVGGYRLWSGMQERRVTSAARDLSAAVRQLGTNRVAAIDDLRGLVRRAPTKGLEASARLELGGALRVEAHQSEEQRQALLEESVATLKAVVDDPQMPGQLAAAAAFSLATSYESLRQFDDAERMYQLLVDSERFGGTAFPFVAAGRVETLDELRTPVTFQPGLPPEPAVATTPAATSTPPAGADAPRTFPQMLRSEELGPPLPRLPAAAPTPEPAEETRPEEPTAADEPAATEPASSNPPPEQPAEPGGDSGEHP